jgi:hypothetical protein
MTIKYRRPSKIKKEIEEQLKSIQNKRARIVIEHILEHGFITTEDLEEKYGYNHPPRAARDVREAGIPLYTYRVQSSDGRRSIAAYKFGDLSKISKGKIEGRLAFPKKLKDALYQLSDGKCAICSGAFEARYLQIDHRVPYEVAGDRSHTNWDTGDYMLICGSCNRAKSWSCEHCPNWKDDKVPAVCERCYWANPTDYVHIALREVRRADIIWTEKEVQSYEKLKQAANQGKTRVPDFVKQIVNRSLPE